MSAVKTPVSLAKRIGFFGLHAGWWYSAAASFAVFSYSLWHSHAIYLAECGGGACNLFQLTPAETADLAGFGISVPLYAAVVTILIAIQFLTFFTIGCYIYYYGHKDSVSVLISVLLIATGATLSLQPEPFAASEAMSPLVRWVNFIGASYMFIAFLYPDGTFAPRWTIVPALTGLIGNAAMYAVPGSVLDPNAWPVWLRSGLFLLIHSALVYSQLYRYRRVSTEEQKRQTRWLVASLAAFVASVALSLTLQVVDHGAVKLLNWFVLYGGLLLMPFAIGISVLEGRLRSMSMLFNRTVIYSLMTVFTISVAVLTAGTFGRILNRSGNEFVVLGATGLAAALFQPVRRMLQNALNRLVYGEREEPYAVLSQLTRELDASFAKPSVLHHIVERVAKALRVPYVAIEVRRDGEEGSPQTFAYGRPDGAVSDIRLALDGEQVGTLRIGARHWRDTLPPDKLELLDDLVRHVAIAVRAERMARDLRLSREKLVTAREEERRRLQKDLHDGLGADLAGIGLQLDRIRGHAGLPAETQAALGEARSQLRETIRSVRRLVYALRPLELDELGFAAALRELQYQFESPAMRVLVRIREPLPPLPAAVEAAAYRIAQECLANSVRHSGAGRCEVHVEAEAELIVEVSDNGAGFVPAARRGVGLTSMRERAEEIGGRLVVRSAPNEGTSVRFAVPLKEENRNA